MENIRMWKFTGEVIHPSRAFCGAGFTSFYGVTTLWVKQARPRLHLYKMLLLELSIFGIFSLFLSPFFIFLSFKSKEKSIIQEIKQ